MARPNATDAKKFERLNKLRKMLPEQLRVTNYNNNGSNYSKRFNSPEKSRRYYEENMEA